MSFEEEFDKIIRQKADEVEFPFEEKNWESAKTMINTDRKTARNLQFKKILKPALALTAVVSGLFMSIHYLGSETLNPQTSATQSTTRNQKQSESIPSTTSKSAVSQVQIKLPVSSKDQAAEPSNANTNESSLPSDKSLNAKTQINTSHISSISQRNEIVNNTNEQSFSESNKTKPISAAAVESVISPATASGISSTPETDLLGTTENNNTTIQNNDESNINKQVNTGSQESMTQESVTETELKTDYLASTILTLTSTANDLSVQLVGIQMVKKNDYFEPKRKTHYLKAEAGLNYLTGWSTLNEKDGKGLNYYGGLSYGFYLSNNLSIGIGAQVSNIANMQNPYYMSSHKIYDFGSTTIYTVVTCSQLYFVSLPLKVSYSLSKSSSLQLGFTASYLYNADIKTETYYFLDGAKVQTNAPVNEKAIYDGIEQYNYTLSAAYTHRLGKRLGITAEFVYGLTDLYKNNAINTRSEKTNGIRLGLSYSLFDK